MDNREYVSVVADYLPDGTIRPVLIAFADDSAFTVTGIKSVVNMSATKQNGTETRYCVEAGGSEHYLFFEAAGQKNPPGWFVLDHSAAAPRLPDN